MSGQNRIISNIPNFITILNLLSGCLAILWSFDDIKISVFFIFAAALFDFGDGLAARLLKAYSNLGKELDSLADIVSFGVAPAMIMHHLLRMSIIDKDSSFTFETATGIQLIIILIPFLLVAFSAIRLAKFNIDNRQQDSFIGLPTPASGILIASISYILLISETDLKSNILLSTPLLILLVLLLCFLMVSNIPMFSLKFKTLSLNDNKIRYIFFVLVILLVVFLKFWALPALIFAYIILSVLNTWIFKLN
jgi:CDP-diacylglycerol---serine O-phosphatidyltransferase